MLHDFLTRNHDELIQRCQAKVAKRVAPKGLTEVVDHGVPLFLRQLEETLYVEQNTTDRDEVDTKPAPASTIIGRAAALHGAELLHRGYSVDQVVHDYGDVCQTVTALAVEQKADISTDEFRTLNRCLDNAIADAVAAFGSAGRESLSAQAANLQQRLVVFANEQQRLVKIITHAYTAIQTGNVAVNGATGALLMHALVELEALTTRTMPDLCLAPISEGTLRGSAPDLVYAATAANC